MGAYFLHLNHGVWLPAPGPIRAALTACALRYLAGLEVTVCNPDGQPYLCLTVPTKGAARDERVSDGR